MNRDCHGDLFFVCGERYYRCLMNSAIMPAPESSACPECGRPIDALIHGACQVVTRRFVQIPDVGEFEFPY